MEILFVSLIVLLSTNDYMITVVKTIRVLNFSFSLGGFVSSPKLMSVSANYFLSLVHHFDHVFLLHGKLLLSMTQIGGHQISSLLF